MADLRALRDRLLALAEHQIESLEDATPKRQIAAATVAGIAIQRALEVERHLSTLGALPEDLPDDDDAARRLVRRALWLRTRAGSAAATRDLATKLGVQNARSQGVEVTFSDDVASLVGDDAADSD